MARIENRRALRKATEGYFRPLKIIRFPCPSGVMRDVASIATLGKVWKGVLGEEVTGTKTTLDDWVARHGGSVTNVGLHDATVVQYTQLFLHRLAPEWPVARRGPRRHRQRGAATRDAAALELLQARGARGGRARGKAAARLKGMGQGVGGQEGEQCAWQACSKKGNIFRIPAPAH